METVVGIFQSRPDAEQARLQLHLQGVDNDKIATLAPGIAPGINEQPMPASTCSNNPDTPCVGGALGSTVGAAMGAAGGASLAAAATSLLVPAVAPIVVAGVVGATLLGAGGALAGAFVGNAVEHELAQTLPDDARLVYEDALRKGHSVLMISADDSETANRVRQTLNEVGAESFDEAREDWWLGLQDAEREKYERELESGGVH